MYFCLEQKKEKPKQQPMGEVEGRIKLFIGRSNIDVLSLRRRFYWKVEDRRLFSYTMYQRGEGEREREREKQGKPVKLIFSNRVTVSNKIIPTSPLCINPFNNCHNTQLLKLIKEIEFKIGVNLIWGDII